MVLTEISAAGAMTRPADVVVSETTTTTSPAVQLLKDDDAAAVVIMDVWVALSGGGLRSCAVSVGVLDALDERKTEFRMGKISCVSGGSYAGAAYVSAKWKEGWSDENFLERAAKELNIIPMYIGCICFILGLVVLFGLVQGLLTLASFLVIICCIAWARNQPIGRYKGWETGDRLHGKIRRKIGYLVSFNELDYLGDSLPSKILAIVGSIWISILETIWMIDFLFVLPCVLGLCVIFPHAVVLAIVVQRFADPYVWMECPSDCAIDGTWNWSTNDGKVLTSVPLLMLAPLVSLSILTVANTLRRFAEKRFSLRSAPVFGTNFTKKLWRGWILLFSLCLAAFICLCYPHIVCCAEYEFIARMFFVAGIILILVWIPSEGGFVVAWSAAALYTHMYLEGHGPPKDAGPVPREHNAARALSWAPSHIKAYWTYHMFAAAGLFFLMPLLSGWKNHCMNNYYRHRLSRSFYQHRYLTIKSMGSFVRYCFDTNKNIPRALVAVHVFFVVLTCGLDFVVHDVLRFPFSCIKCHFLPYDETSFADVKANKRAQGAASNPDQTTINPERKMVTTSQDEELPHLLIQMALQYWNWDFTGSNREQFNIFDDGVTQRNIFFSDTDSSMLHQRGYRFVNYDVDCQDEALLTAVSTSGAAVGANLGSSHLQALPSSMVTLLGGCCSRRFKFSRDGRVTTCESVWDWMIEYFVFLFMGGMLLIKIVSDLADDQEVEWSVDFILMCAVMCFAASVFAIMTMPFEALYWIKQGRLAYDYIANLFLVLGISYYHLWSYTEYEKAPSFMPLRVIKFLLSPFCPANSKTARGQEDSGNGDDAQQQNPDGMMQQDPISAKEALKDGRKLSGGPNVCFLSDGGHFENLGLLPLLYRAARLPADQSPPPIIVMDSSEATPESELAVLMHAVRLAKDVLNLSCRVEHAIKDPWEQRCPSLLTVTAVRNMSSEDQKTWVEIGGPDPSPDLFARITGVDNTELNKLLYFGLVKRFPKIWNQLIGPDEEEEYVNTDLTERRSTRMNDHFIHLVFTEDDPVQGRVGKEINVFFLRPQFLPNDELSVQDAKESLHDANKLFSRPHLGRAMTLLAFAVIIGGGIGACVDLMIPIVGSRVANETTRALPGLVLAFIIVLLEIIFLGLDYFPGDMFASTIKFLFLPGVQFAASSFPIAWIEAYPVLSLYATRWAICFACYGVLCGVCPGTFLQPFTGKFPNHSTAFMQPLSDSKVFDVYHKAGYYAVQGLLARIKRRIAKEPAEPDEPVLSQQDGNPATEDLDTAASNLVKAVAKRAEINATLEDDPALQRLKAEIIMYINDHRTAEPTIG